MSEQAKADALKNMDAPVSGTTYGWIDIPSEDLPHGGRLYPDTWKFRILPAITSHVRHFSSLDEENPFSVVTTLNNLIKTNVRIIDNDKVLTGDNINESDRFFFVLKVKEYTGMTKTITYEHKCNAGSCNHVNQVTLMAAKLKFTELTDKAKKYLNNGSFVIETKSLGTLVYRPTTIKESIKLQTYIVDCEKNKVEYENNFTKIYPFLRTDDQSEIKDLYNTYLGLSKSKYDIYFTLASKEFDIRTLNEVDSKCESCDCRLSAPIQFPDGLPNIFSADNIYDELL